METEDQVESALFLDIVVRQDLAIIKLLAGKDQVLLIWGDALLVLDGGHLPDGRHLLDAYISQMADIYQMVDSCQMLT